MKRRVAMDHHANEGFINRFGFYFGVLVAAAVVWAIQAGIEHGGTVYPAAIEEKAVDAFMEMNRLLTTLATTLLGAMGLFLTGGSKARPRPRELWSAVAGALFLAISIYFGYVAYLQVISMLANGAFDPYNRQLWGNQHVHFYTFLAGVVLFGGFAYKNTCQDRYCDENTNASTRS